MGHGGKPGKSCRGSRMSCERVELPRTAPVVAAKPDPTPEETPMPRNDWRDREDDRARRRDPRDEEGFGLADYSRDYEYDPDSRSGRRVEERVRGRDDYGQADYSRDWAYDEERGRPYRRSAEPDVDRDARIRRDEREREEDERGEPRSWMGRAGDFLAGRRGYDDRRDDDDRREEERRGERRYDDRRRRRRGPSDRVLWAVIVERLEDERGLDLRDVDVLVDDCEVTLNGTVRRKEDKRRIEDIADIDGVRHVQNNLRVRERPHWTFL